jgi:hypothetical protein
MNAASGVRRPAYVLTGALLLAATAAVLVSATPNLVAAQSGTPSLGFKASSWDDAIDSKSDARLAGMLVGGILGGTVGGSITIGCLWLTGMGAPAALPWCLIPTVAGVAFGAWAGREVADALNGG